MELTELLLVILVTKTCVVMSDFVYEHTLPESVRKCFQLARNQPVNVELAERACVMAYFNQISQPRNLTESDKAFFQERIDSRFGFYPPESGYRRRRDIRTLTEEERERLFSVLQTMYWDGTLHRFGRLHGQTKKKVHRGAVFLPWHRVFILNFEEEMRKIDDRVFLPYWDYTMDNNITRPSDSVVWSPCFFGNGVGIIESGPFKNWYGGHSIQMTRDYARSGQCPPRLINKMDIKGILEKCHFREVTTGDGDYFQNAQNIEMLHDGVHDWVGGDMDENPYAAYDPVFFMHHAFIDYIWQKFREHQIESCKVDPETDWRPDDDLCQVGREDMGPDDTMYGYTHLRNKDGLWKSWTDMFYNYEDQPSCPYCGHSEYLYCDRTADPKFPDGICLTKTKAACKIKDLGFNNEIGYQTEPSLVLHYPIQSVHLLKGLPGDGRHRDMSLDESSKILQAETAKGVLETKSDVTRMWIKYTNLNIDGLTDERTSNQDSNDASRIRIALWTTYLIVGVSFVSICKQIQRLEYN